MILDIRYVWLVAAILSSSSGALFFIFRRNYSGYLRKALTYWGAACLSLGACSWISAASPRMMLSIIPVSLTTVTLVFEYVAVAALQQKPFSKAWVLIPPAATVIVYLWFSSVQHNVTIGALLLNVIRITLMARIALSFYRSETDQRFLTDLLSSAVFALMTLSTAGVILSFLRSDHFAPDSDFNTIRTFYNITAIVVAQSVVFSLFLAGMTERLNRDLKRLAMIDPLTDIYNRRAIEEIGSHETSRSVRTGHPISLFMIDIDHFKWVNDTHGHLVGDRVLRAAADTLKNALRAETYIARWGGDEFCALLPGADPSDAEVAAKRLMKAFSELEISIDGHFIRLDISIGIVSKSGDVTEFSSLIQMADMALYKAKGAGRRAFAFA